MTCPTCQWRNRETTDMVCMTCGRDYLADDPVPGLGWKRLMIAWREQCKAAETKLAEVETEREALRDRTPYVKCQCGRAVYLAAARREGDQ